MIVSVNTKPEISDFRKLMTASDLLLNKDASARPEYYLKRGGSLLEDDVVAALKECVIGTPFQGTIEKISGQKFPDIVAARFYGVEVKSTKENHWTSTGSSILETTRIPNVERIYMTFGKLGGSPIEFRSRLYEECLSGIAVTHMPRYLIDMRLKPGETIFDKMGVEYEALRKMKNPIEPVSQYYRSHLKKGESLWWVGNATEESVPPTIRLWKNLSTDERKEYTVYGCAIFPEVFGGDYDRYALWLASQGVVDSHVRDQFSAGGQEEMLLSNGQWVKFPGVYRRVRNNVELFLDIIKRQVMTLNSKYPIENNSEQIYCLLKWCDAASHAANVEYEQSMDALSMLFFKKSYKELQIYCKRQKFRVIYLN